jgi:hypothetical protein
MSILPDAKTSFSFLDTSLDWLFTPPSISVADSAWAGHVPFANWLMHVTQPGLLVELGTHSGTSFFAFCETVRREKLGTRCVAVDTWEGDAHAGHYSTEVYDMVKKLAELRYRSIAILLKKTFDEALQNIADGSVDVLHIDGLHTYEAVRHDFETWLPKLSDSAVVLFHDTAVRDRGFGVYQYFAELRQEYPGFDFAHSHGLGVLQVGANVTPAMRSLCSTPEGPVADRIRERFAYLGKRIEMQNTLFRHGIPLP